MKTENPLDGKKQRHSRKCCICSHPERDQIESEFIAWIAPSKIAKTHRIRRDTIYTHAAAVGLTIARERNVKAALSNFIERCHRVRPSAAAMVTACIALSKLNAEGQTVERLAVSTSNENFSRWTRGELQDFLLHTILPDWYQGPLRKLENKPANDGSEGRVN